MLTNKYKMFSVSNKLTRSTWEIHFQLQTTTPKRRHRYLLTFFITNFSQIQHFVLAVLFLTIHNYFSFYLEHLNTYETTFSCILVIETYVDIRWPKRDTGPLKHIRWRSLTIFEFPFFNNCHKELQLRSCRHPTSDSHYRHFHFAELGLNQFEANFPSMQKLVSQL